MTAPPTPAVRGMRERGTFYVARHWFGMFRAGEERGMGVERDARVEVSDRKVEGGAVWCGYEKVLL